MEASSSVYTIESEIYFWYSFHFVF